MSNAPKICATRCCCSALILGSIVGISIFDDCVTHGLLGAGWAVTVVVVRSAMLTAAVMAKWTDRTQLVMAADGQLKLSVKVALLLQPLRRGCAAFLSMLRSWSLCSDLP